MDRPQNVSFVLKNLENLDKSSLYFVVEEGKGNLNILLNGRSVYSGTAEGVMLFELPLGYLKEENELMIQSFSDIFFMGSSYVLKDFKVIKKYRVENKEARRVFSVPSGVSFVNLKYYLFCGGTVKGKLKISVNGNEVYYGIPSCGVYTESDIPLNYLKKGDNVMEFGIDKGDYVIENIIVLVEVMEEKAEYSFSLSDSEFDDVNSGNLDVLLEASFDNYAEGDEARVYVNDNSFVIEVDDFTDEVISEYVEVGKNLIRIRPLDGFEVTDLRVRFV